VERFAEAVYFLGIFGALPGFVGLQIVALFIFKGWSKLIAFIPGAYVGYALLVDFAEGAGAYLDGAMDRDGLVRFLYLQLSILSRPLLVALGCLLGMIVVRATYRRQRARAGMKISA
jgi:hypothetical protein